VQLYNSSTALFKEVACEAPGIEPQTTTWISARTLSKVIVKWTSNYVQPFSLPDNNYAPHVGNAPVPIGVSDTGFSVSVPGTSTSTLQNKTTQDKGSLHDMIMTNNKTDYA